MRRVLTIDGGGIKGVFPAAMLTEFEKKLPGRSADYFDLIAGTSTGGIIALALGLRIPAADILRFYLDEGPAIFAARGPLGAARAFFTSRYDPTPLKDALERVYMGAFVGQSHTRLVIPTLSLQTGRVQILKTAHHPDFERDYLETMTSAAMATAAAPTYFPSYRLASGIPLIDGGLWANNPMGVAAVEAIGILGWQRGDVEMLSLGCTDELVTLREPKRARVGLTYWAPKLVDTFLAGQSSSARGTAKTLLGKDHVMRISPPTARGAFRLDDVDKRDELARLASEYARSEVPEVRDRFLTTPAESFVPYRQVLP